MDVTSQQITEAAEAALDFFSLETTLIPGDKRRQLAVLEAFLAGLVSGNLQVVNSRKTPVESESETGSKPEVESDLAGASGDAEGHNSSSQEG